MSNFNMYFDVSSQLTPNLLKAEVREALSSLPEKSYLIREDLFDGYPCGKLVQRIYVNDRLISHEDYIQISRLL